MKFYCGIDLSARDCHVCVIDEQLKVMVQQKLRNELPKRVLLLEPYKANLKIVVESSDVRRKYPVKTVLSLNRELSVLVLVGFLLLNSG